jgi:hypothetical protein
MKRIIGLILLIIFTVGCQTSKTENIEVNRMKIEATPKPRVEIPELTKEQKKKLDSILPTTARKILENSKEFEIQGGSGSSFFTPIKQIKISDRILMNRLSNAVYIDVVNSSGMAGCFKPRHNLRAEYEGKSLNLVICYECSYLKGYVSGKEFISGMDEKLSKELFDEILDKAEEIKSN